MRFFLYFYLNLKYKIMVANFFEVLTVFVISVIVWELGKKYLTKLYNRFFNK